MLTLARHAYGFDILEQPADTAQFILKTVADYTQLIQENEEKSQIERGN